MVYTSFSYEETQNIGQVIARRLRPGDVVALEGDLGAGKTALTSGIAQYFGFDDGISSPTFTIVNQYDAPRMTLYHLDVYRISEDELFDIGLEDMLYGDGVTLIEWAGKIKAALPRNTVWVSMRRDDTKGLDYREILVDWGDGREDTGS